MKKPRPPVDLLAVGPERAAEMLDVSRDHLERHVLPDLKTIRRGRRIFIPVREIERWLEANASRPLEGDTHPKEAA
jgi:hypothetical protein